MQHHSGSLPCRSSIWTIQGRYFRSDTGVRKAAFYFSVPRTGKDTVLTKLIKKIPLAAA